MRRNLLPVAGTIFLILVAVAVSQFSAPFRGYLTSATRTVFGAPLAFVGKSFGLDGGVDLERLAAENARLKAELLFLSTEPKPVGTPGRPELIARVHSTYPTNNRGLVTVNAGTLEGVRKGMAVTVDGFTFLGVVEDVGSDWSVVRTIFDTGWQLPVKIGADAIDALLIGGREPRLTLIVKSGKVLEGDPIYTASKDFPYGLKIGEVTTVGGEPGSAFEEGDIAFPYEVNLPQVVILL